MLMRSSESQPFVARFVTNLFFSFPYIFFLYLLFILLRLRRSMGTLSEKNSTLTSPPPAALPLPFFSLLPFLLRRERPCLLLLPAFFFSPFSSGTPPFHLCKAFFFSLFSCLFPAPSLEPVLFSQHLHTNTPTTSSSLSFFFIPSPHHPFCLSYPTPSLQTYLCPRLSISPSPPPSHALVLMEIPSPPPHLQPPSTSSRVAFFRSARLCLCRPAPPRQRKLYIQTASKLPGLAYSPPLRTLSKVERYSFAFTLSTSMGTFCVEPLFVTHTCTTPPPLSAESGWSRDRRRRTTTMPCEEAESHPPVRQPPIVPDKWAWRSSPSLPALSFSFFDATWAGVLRLPKPPPPHLSSHLCMPA